MELLKRLCQVQAPSGDESPMKDFIIEYVHQNQSNWVVKPEIITSPDLMDCVLLVFGKPRTAVFAHMDSIGFTVGYRKKLHKIGGPKAQTGWPLVGRDSQGDVLCELIASEDGQSLTYECDRDIDLGTQLTFKCDFRTSDEYIQSCYLDNRLGVWNALQQAEVLANGILCFTCYEETGGGSAAFVAKYIYEHYQVRQALISDITWVTRGIKHNKGVAISLRDSGIPRRSYLHRIIDLAQKSGIPYQLEVEEAGGSDGNVIHRSPYPIDWCFIGAAESQVHTPDEKAHKNDIQAMVDMYRHLLEKL